jgi:transketolase
MAYAGSTVHIPCAFSLVEILAVLYRSHLRLGSAGPRSTDRDYLVLSKGHGIMAQYACLHELGWITKEQIRSYCRDKTLLKGLADAHVPGLEVSSGSLGHGLPVGVGLALAAKRRGTSQRCFAIVGDGELNEGSIWEAIMFAAHFELSNLLIIVDKNGHQAMGRTDDVMNLKDLSTKFRAFGLTTVEVNGHDEPAIDSAIHSLLTSTLPVPKVIVAHTVKGKGVSFMEDDNRWHYRRLNAESYAAALTELAV